LSLINRSKVIADKKKIFTVFSRNAVIIPEFINFKFNVHNGRDFKLLKVSKSMVGYKFGEFVFTKKFGNSIHKKKITKFQNKVEKHKFTLKD
jgi:ribosomal protein S19